MIKKKYLLLVSILGITSIGAAFLVGNNLSCKKIFCLSLKDASEYKLKEIYEENQYIFRGLYGKDDILLRLEIRYNATKSEAEQAIKNQIMRTQALFDEAAAPYPGDISDIVSCSKEYIPKHTTKTKNEVSISHFSGFVNERLVFGSCTADQLKYFDTLSMFYCDKQKKFFQVELIIPKDEYLKDPSEYKEILNSLGCKQ